MISKTFQGFSTTIAISFLFLLAAGNSVQLVSARDAYLNAPRHTLRLGEQSHQIRGDHISLQFYVAADRAELFKRRLQHTLHNFLDNLQRNLSTSTVLNNNNNNNINNIVDVEKTQRQLAKLNDLAAFFHTTSDKAGDFASRAEAYFEVMKNESAALLLKLRHMPTAHRALPNQVKQHLTDYFTEMEFLHVMFSEIVDEVMEYIVEEVHATRRTFIRYADIQRDVLRNWNFKLDESCVNRYMDFLLQWSSYVYKCAADIELHTAYDVYATAELTAKYVLRQLEFRIQRLFNCFLFGNYAIRCRFLRHAEDDFKKLFAKLEELQAYYDIKAKRGLVTGYRHRIRRQQYTLNRAAGATVAEVADEEPQDKCIPYGFPDTQMSSSLKTCFYFRDFN